MMVVFKLGGSSMTLPGLTERIRLAIGQRPGCKALVVSGGGKSTDIVREWSRIHCLNDETAHWLAMSSLDLNRRLLEELLGWQSVIAFAAAEAHWEHNQTPVLLNMKEYVAAEEVNGADSPPHNWDVTSDSLALWVANRWQADEFVLVKSVPVPFGQTAEKAAIDGLVDNYFPKLVSRFPRISWCNLRAASIVIDPWLAADDFSE